MSEYLTLRNAFVQVVGEPIREPEDQLPIDHVPATVFWLSRNVWLNPNNAWAHDVQFHAWHGEAWTAPGSRQSGLWCGLGIEYKDVFRVVLANTRTSRESFERIAEELVEFRIGLGEAGRNSGSQYTDIHCGYWTRDADYSLVFRRIQEIQAHRGLPRPHLQVYKQIGKWDDPENSVGSLAEQIRSVRDELSPLFQLVTGGGCRLYR